MAKDSKERFKQHSPVNVRELESARIAACKARADVVEAVERLCNAEVLYTALRSNADSNILALHRKMIIKAVE